MACGLQQQVLRGLVLSLIMIIYTRAFMLNRNALCHVDLKRGGPLLKERMCVSRTASKMRRIPPRIPDHSWGPLFSEKRSARFRLALFSSATERQLDDTEDDDETAESIENKRTFTPGVPQGFFIIDHFATPPEGFDMELVRERLGASEIDRLKLTSDNITLPIALMLLDESNHKSFSRARKSCRKGSILIHRGPLSANETTGEQDVFDPQKCIRGRVGDRVYTGGKTNMSIKDRVHGHSLTLAISDVIAKQVRMGNGWYNATYHEKPPFDLPVVYEDDHFAIGTYGTNTKYGTNPTCCAQSVCFVVNKPAGIVTYSHRGAGHGRMSVKAALPFVVKAPKAGTFSITSRPIACHRLDKPTSGLVSPLCVDRQLFLPLFLMFAKLVIAKTKPAMVHLTRQFAERKVKKTYTAIVNGIPDEPPEKSITSEFAHRLGVDVSPDDEKPWQIIDVTLDDKHAITVWRPLRYVHSLKAREGVLTLVELKPKTGRFHQLRRHMAWVLECPLVGDKDYDGGREAMMFRERGLFLCSNRVTLEHPYYNTEAGRKEWETLGDDAKFAGGMLSLSKDGIVRITASIDLPTKFESFLTREEARSSKFVAAENSAQ